MSETRQARNLFFYALAAYVAVCWLAANWPKDVVPPETRVPESPDQTDPFGSFFVNLWLNAPQFVNLVLTLLAILAHAFTLIGSALNLVS